jgi:hypothetical protein
MAAQPAMLFAALCPSARYSSADKMRATMHQVVREL